MSLVEIAKQAGVSVATVSRVANGHAYVSVEAVRKVRAAMQKVGYEGRAGQMSHKKSNGRQPGWKTGYVGLLAINVPLVSTRQHWMINLIAGIEEALAEHDFHLVLKQVQDPEQFLKQASTFRMDGVLVIGRACDQVRRFIEQMPCVLLMGGSRRPHEATWADSVMVDYEAIGGLAAKYLIDRGHQLLAYLNPQSGHMGFQEIGCAFEAVALRSGGKVIAFNEDIEEDIPVWDPIHSRSTAERFFKDITEYPVGSRPTGVLVTDNDIARHLCLLSSHYNLKPGKDFEIICRDNVSFFSGEMDPPPAAIYADHQEIGRCAVERLLYRMKYPVAPMGTRLLVPPLKSF